MNIENVSISAIKPYPKNAKKHPKEQVEKIMRSIERFGWAQPLVVDKENVLIIGHGRLEAAKKLKMDTVPVLRMENLSNEEVNALRLADNKLNESEWDMELVNLELGEMSDELKELTGFEPMEVLEAQEDDFDTTPPVEPKSKLGDLYQLGEHRLLCGDATKIEDVERLMSGEKADMVFTDPPYGMSLDADYSSLSWGDRKGKKYENVIGDHEDFKPELISTIFDSFGYCKEIFLWGADYYFELIPDFKKGHYIVWDKTLASNGDAGSNSEYELVWTKSRHKRQVIHFNWFRYFGLQQQDIKTREHPTQKPLQVCTPFIEQYSEKSNVVVDLFGGSGSTLVACEQTGRKCRMMELDPRYCDVIIARWEKLTGKKAELIT